jgi:predicted ATPase with chaperone activity
MPLAETLGTTRIYSVAGCTGKRTAVVTTRPFRAPHHTISDVGLIGGGQVPTTSPREAPCRDSLVFPHESFTRRPPCQTAFT